MNKLSKILVVGLPVLFLAAACNQTPAAVTDTKGVSHISQSVQGQVQNQKMEFSAGENKTALDLLRASYTLQTKNFGSGLGEFVEEINGTKPAKNEFWAFYVNGKSSNVGASSYFPKDGDSLEWKIDKINETPQ